jgi:hypothetical protein
VELLLIDPWYCVLLYFLIQVNQHAGSEQSADLQGLRDVIRSADGGTLLMMEEHGSLLHRVWCVYEIHQTLLSRGSSQLYSVMSNLGRSHEEAQVTLERILELHQTVDVLAAASTVAADRIAILADIEASTMNVAALNVALRDVLALTITVVIDSVRRKWQGQIEGEVNEYMQVDYPGNNNAVGLAEIDMDIRVLECEKKMQVALVSARAALVWGVLGRFEQAQGLLTEARKDYVAGSAALLAFLWCLVMITRSLSSRSSARYKPSTMPLTNSPR